MSDVELKILRESNSVTKNRLDQNHEDLVSLKQRFERILDTGKDTISDDFMDMPTDSPPENSNNSSTSNAAPSQSEIITPTPSQTSLTTQGEVEIYSSSGKPVPVYQDATTISNIKAYIANKSITTFSQKTTGWYQIKMPDSEQYVWISEQNIRR